MGLSSYAGRREGNRLNLVNKNNEEILVFSRINAINLYTNERYDRIIHNNEEYKCSHIDVTMYKDILTIPANYNYFNMGELPWKSADYDTFSYFYSYFLFFNTNGSLIRRVDDISKELVIEITGNCSITITENEPIGSVPLNYPTIPEDYSTDSYYIKNNTDELVYVVAPDYIGVPHPEAGTLEEGETLFIPSQQVTNGLSFYRELYPGESFYLGKAAHPEGQEYIKNASDGFNEYLSLIYLLTPEMNLLYRLENFENYEFTESEDSRGKKVVLELQEEMSVRHSEYFMADF